MHCCVLVNRLESDLTAYAPLNGETLWSLERSRGFPTIHVDGETVYVTGQYGVDALEAGTGKRLWSKDTGSVSSSAFEAGTLFILQVNHKNGPRLSALDVANQSIRWTARINDNLLDEVQVLDGVVYLTSQTELYAVEAGTGQILWDRRLSYGRNVHLVDNVLYVFDGLGQRLIAYNPRTGQELGAIQYALPQLYSFLTTNMAQLDGWLFVAEGRNLHAFAP
jgi:outer membrane protein assembly factor BamB